MSLGQAVRAVTDPTLMKQRRQQPIRAWRLYISPISCRIGCLLGSSSGIVVRNLKQTQTHIHVQCFCTYCTCTCISVQNVLQFWTQLHCSCTFVNNKENHRNVLRSFRSPTSLPLLIYLHVLCICMCCVHVCAVYMYVHINSQQCNCTNDSYLNMTKRGDPMESSKDLKCTITYINVRTCSQLFQKE